MDRNSSDYKQIVNELNFGYLGSYKVAGMGEPWLIKIGENHMVLKDLGIGAILTLTEEDDLQEQHKKSGFQQLHLPVDDTMPPTVDTMKKALDFIDLSLEENLGVAVHCLEGRGRTGTVLCAWIAKEESLNYEEAIKRVHELRPYCVITKAQRKFLEVFIDKNGIK